MGRWNGYLRFVCGVAIAAGLRTQLGCSGSEGRIADICEQDPTQAICGDANVASRVDAAGPDASGEEPEASAPAIDAASDGSLTADALDRSSDASDADTGLVMGNEDASGDAPDASDDAGLDAETVEAAPPTFVATVTPCAPLVSSGKTVLDVGHGSAIVVVKQSGNRILTQDLDGHWILWDVTHRTQVASGDSTVPNVGVELTLQPPPAILSDSTAPNAYPVDMAGSVVAILDAASVTLLSAVDGHLLSRVTNVPVEFFPGTFGMATDGSYFWLASSTNLGIWSSTTGKSIANRSGYYQNASIYAAPTELRIVGGPNGDLETVTATTGTSKIVLKSNTLQAGPGNWFSDGSKFSTSVLQDGNAGPTSTLTFYSSTGAKLGTTVLPFLTNGIVGTGNFYATDVEDQNDPPEVYLVGGSATPIWTDASTNPTNALQVAGAKVAWIEDLPNVVHMLDLSGTAPVESSVTLPSPATLALLDADSANNWAMTYDSLVFDSVSAMGSTGPQSLDCGLVGAIVGSASGRVAIGTEIGQTLFFDLGSTSRTPVTALALSLDEGVFSSDGTVLAAEDPSNQSVRILGIPSGVTLGTFAPQGGIASFSISGSGTTFAETSFASNFATNSETVTRRIFDVPSGPPSFTYAFPVTRGIEIGPVALSPNGTLLAMSDSPTNNLSAAATTNIYNGGRIVGTVAGYPQAFLDDTHLLISRYFIPDGGPEITTFTGMFTCDPTGANLTPVGLGDDLGQLMPVGTSQVYTGADNSIHDVADGGVVWSTSDSISGPVAVAGGFVVFPEGHVVVAEPH